MIRRNKDERPSAQRRRLEQLEETIVAGSLAYNERNDLIAALADDGWKHIEITRVLNVVRERTGAPTLSPDAVSAIVKKVRRQEEAQ